MHGEGIWGRFAEDEPREDCVLQAHRWWVVGSLQTVSCLENVEQYTPQCDIGVAQSWMLAQAGPPLCDACCQGRVSCQRGNTPGFV